MAIHESLYSSRSDDWPTPQHFFDMLNGEFNFSLDPCATAANTKCSTYFTAKDRAILESW